MSIENVERFVVDAKTNAELEKKLKDAVGIPAVVEVANKHGHKITEAGMRAYLEQHNTELSEEELDGVAAGVVWGLNDKFP